MEKQGVFFLGVVLRDRSELQPSPLLINHVLFFSPLAAPLSLLAAPPRLVGSSSPTRD